MLENADEVEDDFDDTEDDEEGDNSISVAGNEESDFNGTAEDEECNLFGRKSQSQFDLNTLESKQIDLSVWRGFLEK